MADARPNVSLSSLTPEQVARADFSSSFRGFDHTEVRAFLARVAGEMRSLADREGELAARLAESEGRPPTLVGELDVHLVTERLGIEAASVLEAARDAAAQIRAKAEADAALVRDEADLESSRLLEEAASVLGERSAEAEEAAAAVLAAAEADAATLMAAAETDAAALTTAAATEAEEARAAAEAIRLEAASESESELERARAEGRRMVAEARAVRERILTDMARRRNVARQQLERLRAGRDRLLEAVESVRRAVEETSDELNGSLVDAKLAGERAARQIDVEQVPSPRELELEVELAKEAGLVDTAAVAAAAARPPGAFASAGSGDSLVEAVEVHELADQERADEAEAGVAADEAALLADGPTQFDAELADDASDASDADDAEEPGDTGSSADVEPNETGIEVDDESDNPVADLIVEVDDEIETVRVIGPVASADAPASPVEPLATGADPPVEPGSQPARAPARSRSSRARSSSKGSAPKAKRSGFGSAAEDVFSRLRVDSSTDDGTTAPPAGQQSEAVIAADTDEADTDEADTDEADTAEADVAASAEEAATGDPDAELAAVDAVAVHRRDAQVAVAARDLARLLKLRLADDQNELLEQVRSTSGISAEDLVAVVGDNAGYAEVAERELRASVALGWNAVAGSAGGPVDVDSADGPAGVDVGDTAAMVAAELLDDLRGRLEASVGSGPEAFTELTRALYRDLRNQRATAVAEHAVLTSFGRGQMAAVRAGAAQGETYLLHWTSLSCGPDCLDNSLAGTLSPGEAFPTGHLHPPAFPGCRCLLAVESVTVAASN